jgi:hypothetical protein
MAQFKTDLTPMLLILSFVLSVFFNSQEFHVCAAILTSMGVILMFFACRLLSFVLFFDNLFGTLAYSSKSSILMKALFIYDWLFGAFKRLSLISLLD